LFGFLVLDRSSCWDTLNARSKYPVWTVITGDMQMNTRILKVLFLVSFALLLTCKLDKEYFFESKALAGYLGMVFPLWHMYPDKSSTKAWEFVLLNYVFWKVVDYIFYAVIF
jgi:hypothetical protein